MDLISAAIGFVGALFGAVVGALTTYILEAKRQAKRDLRRRQSLFLKIARIYSLALQFRDYIDEGEAQLATRIEAEPGAPGRVGLHSLMNLVLPYGNLPADVTFEVEDMMALWEADDPQFLNSVDLLDSKLNGLTASLATYGRRRDAAMTSALSAVEGTVGTVIFEGETPELLRYRVEAASLDQILRETRTDADRLANEAFSAMSQLAKSPRFPLGRHFSSKTRDPLGNEVVLSSPAKKVARVRR